MASINANSGSYTIVGASSILAFAIAASTTGYTLTGSDAITRHGYQVVNPPGVYTLTGTAIQSRRIAGEPGSYQVQGQTVTLRYGVQAYTLIPASGSYSATGGSSIIEHAIPYDRGSYALTGTPTTLSSSGSPTLGVDSGTYAITGSLTHLVNVAEIFAGDYTLTGTSATVKKGKGLVGLSGSYTIAPGPTVKLNQTRRLLLNVGSYTLTGNVSNLVHSTSAAKFIIAGVSPYFLTGQSTPLRLNRMVAADSGSYTLTGISTINRTVLPVDSGIYLLTGTLPNLLRDVRLPISIGSYTITGTSTVLILSTPLQNPHMFVDSGTYTLFGFTTNLLATRLLVGDSAGIFTVGGLSTFLRATHLNADGGSYTYTGSSVNLLSTRTGRWRAVLPNRGRWKNQILVSTNTSTLPPATGVS